MSESGSADAPAIERHRRWIALAALVVVIAVGLFVHSVLPDSDVTDIAGDALYAAAAYAGIVMLAPRLRSLIVGALALGWCVAVEFFQLTGIPAAIAGAFRPAALLLGTGFDARDLLVYALAVIVVCTIDLGVRARRR